MGFDEWEILLSAALGGVLPYALMAFVEWSKKRLPLVHRQGSMHHLWSGHCRLN